MLTLKFESRKISLICFISLFLLTLFPFLTNKYPASVDYLNHLTSFYIQANINNDIWLKENYFVEWKLTPYNLIEFLGGFLARYFDISITGKIIFGLGITFISLGSLIIRKCINNYIDLWTCSIFLLIYNYVFFFGFVNYYVSSGLALIAIGLWIKLRDSNFFLNLFIFSVISTALFFSHLYALGIYAIFVISYEIGQKLYSQSKWTSFETLKSLLQFTFPTILFFKWINSLPNKEKVDFYTYGDFNTKIKALFSPLAYDYSRISLLLILLVLISFFILRVRYPEGVSINYKMKYPLLSMLIITIAMPSSLLGAWGTDFRYPFVFIILLIVSIQFEENNPNAVNFRKIFLSIIIITTCLKIYYVSSTWKTMNQKYQEFENAMQYIDLGSKVISIQEDYKNSSDNNLRLYDHIPSLAIMKRSTFWPLFFTNTSIHPTKKTEHIDTTTGPNLTLNDLINNKHKNGDFIAINCKVYWENWDKDFDYLISIKFDDLSIINLKNLKIKHRGSFFDIYQIIH